MKLYKSMHCAARLDCNIGPSDPLVIHATGGVQDSTVSGEAVGDHGGYSSAETAQSGRQPIGFG
jgi:hypothetical protein